MRLVDHHPCLEVGHVEGQLVKSDLDTQVVARDEAGLEVVQNRESAASMASSHIQSSIEAELVLAFARSLAIARVADTPNRQSRPVDSCCL